MSGPFVFEEFVTPGRAVRFEELSHLSGFLESLAAGPVWEGMRRWGSLGNELVVSAGVEYGDFELVFTEGVLTVVHCEFGSPPLPTAPDGSRLGINTAGRAGRSGSARGPSQPESSRGSCR